MNEEQVNGNCLYVTDFYNGFIPTTLYFPPLLEKKVIKNEFH